LKSAIEAFRKLGRFIFKGWEKIHHYVEIPMDDFRTYCSTRPVLAFVLTFIADHVVEILQVKEALVAIEFDGKSDSLAPDFKEMLAKQQKGMVERVHALLTQLERFELPATIIHVEPIYQFVIDELLLFVIGRLGAKGKALKLVLKETNALDLVTSRLAAELVREGVDPNVYWRNDVVPLIKYQFNSARGALVDEIKKVLQAPAFGNMFEAITKPPPITAIPLTGSEFDGGKMDIPEAQLKPSPGVMPLSPESIPMISSGRSLDPAIRAAAEKRFGHDFRHVRIHTASDARAMTAAFRADALTTGSHIFLRPGITPRQGRGKTIFDHELAHVLQQAGPRPLGSVLDSQPVTGKPGRGLNLDAAREAAADRVAALVSGRTSGPPVNVQPEAGGGLQPVLDMNPFTIAKLLRTISSPEAIKKRQVDIEELIKVGTKGKKLRDSVKTGVKAVIEAIKDGGKTKAGARTFEDKGVLQAVATQLNNNMRDIEKAANVIAVSGLEPEQISEPGGAQGAKTKTIELFSPRHFARELEGFILGKTGIVLSLDFSTKEENLEGKKDQLIDQVKEIKVLHIHLPFVEDGRSHLWIDVLDKTWKGTLSDNDRTKYREAAREYLTNKISATVFALFGGSYEFSIITRRGIENLVKRAGGGALPASELPTWQDYVETDHRKVKPHPQHGHVGLRLAHYTHSSQTGTGRESHHLTQYLLADFFSNLNATSKPFTPGRKWPGVKMASKGVDSFQAPGRDVIQIRKTRDDDRGGPMPAISLAASTHEGGSLHITSEVDDYARGKAKSAQSYALYNEFKDHLPKPLHKDSKKDVHDKYLQNTAEDVVKEEVYVAIEKTYQEVRRHMAGRLKTALPLYEVAYYESKTEDNVARKLTSTDKDLFVAALKDVADKAERHNMHGDGTSIGMESLGWKASI
jgi:hypothetical protein